jgi:hypothetical protein
MYSGIGWYTNLETGCITIGAKLMSTRFLPPIQYADMSSAGEDFGVVSKFYAEPIGGNRNYNAEQAMNREFDKLQKADGIIDVSRPLVKKKRFNCALVTEYVEGKPLNSYIKSEDGLYDRLTAVAQLLRRLHDNTATKYCKDKEFGLFHNVLDQMGVYGHTRERYNYLLGN